MKKETICQLCRRSIEDSRSIRWNNSLIHLTCYTPEIQEDYDVVYRTDRYAGERSPYWDWVEQRNRSEEVREMEVANPDFLPENEEYEERREYYGEMIEIALAAFSPREIEVFIGLKNGLEEKEISEQLGISRSRVHRCRERILKKFKEHGDIEAG